MRKITYGFAGLLNGLYYLIVLDSFKKWRKILKSKRPTTAITIKFLWEPFVRFAVPDYATEHLTTQFYHPRSNGQAERFVNTLKRALSKRFEAEETTQESLSVYRMSSEKNLTAKMSTAELTFAIKVTSIFKNYCQGKRRMFDNFNSS